MWAEQQLASARMAVEAQLEIDREQQRRRVIEASGPTVTARSERIPPAALADVYLPIAAEAEAASLFPAELPVAPDVADNLPSRVDDDRSVEQTGRSLIPAIPDVTRAAVRWIRPLVPPIIASAIDTTTKPLRGVRQIFEETEEIHISMRRTHRVSSAVEETEGVVGERVPDAEPGPRRTTTVHRDNRGQGYDPLDSADHAAHAITSGRRELPPGR